jgi:hypothetical protein
MTDDPLTPRGLWRSLTAGDRLVVLGLLVLSVAGALLLRGAGGAPTHAVVTVDREPVAVLPLDRADRLVVEGRTGPVTIEVRGGGVRVVESTCPHRICVAMGEKRRSGEVIACVPNALLVRLTGGREDADVPDAVSR